MPAALRSLVASCARGVIMSPRREAGLDVPVLLAGLAARFLVHMEAVRTGRQLPERGPQLQPPGAVRGRDRADHRADPVLVDTVHLDDDPFLATGRRDEECRKGGEQAMVQ